MLARLEPIQDQTFVNFEVERLQRLGCMSSSVSEADVYRSRVRFNKLPVKQASVLLYGTHPFEIHTAWIKCVQKSNGHTPKAFGLDRSQFVETIGIDIANRVFGIYGIPVAKSMAAFQR